MDKEQKPRLQQKLKELQLKQQEAKLRQRIAPQISYLEQIKASYQIHPPFKYLLWIQENLNTRKKNGYQGIYDMFQIDTNPTENTQNIRIKAPNLDSPLLSNIITNLDLKDQNIIICRNDGDPELEISLSSFLSKASLFLSSPENWIITEDRQWIFEYFWDDNIIKCFKISPSEQVLKTQIILD